MHLDNALAVGSSARYSGEPNGDSYMEVTVRERATNTAQTHIMKANHPDDARNWVHDFQVTSLPYSSPAVRSPCTQSSCNNLWSVVFPNYIYGALPG